ncbi:EamA family transporter [Yinghuangia soli]|uniref:DMT family transporter n=1 Tax=Yinghuangia soli TaxID=2908204 RepID=A0AA41PX50_9ACTN|nr:DMT family transporter [Yinghuangia soli]MCF2526970.1 DMT family transporter [Yinghuangia soli]
MTHLADDIARTPVASGASLPPNAPAAPATTPTASGAPGALDAPGAPAAPGTVGAAKTRGGQQWGLVLAVVAATAFGMSGSLARGLLDNGWSPGAIVLARTGVGALAMAPFAIAALRGRWRQLRTQARTVLVYGLLGVAGAQFCYFSAVAHMDVAPALLIEYTAPAAVIVWLWVRHGRTPSPLTLAGAGLAALGLVFALDLLSGADLAWAGVAWAFAAMIGATAYFLVAADTGNGLPPIALAGSGLAVGTIALGTLAAVGLLPMHTSTQQAEYAIGTVPWWVPILVLGLVTAALAYAAGTVASRMLGSRVASFAGLLEVVASVGFAWLLIDQVPNAFQTIGGLLIIGGIVLAKLDER